jgi:hypothetical protein
VLALIVLIGCVSSFTGYSDPYVRIEVDGIEAAQTQVKERNLNPTWEEEFKLPIYQLPDPGAASPVVRFDIRYDIT